MNTIYLKFKSKVPEQGSHRRLLRLPEDGHCWRIFFASVPRLFRFAHGQQLGLVVALEESSVPSCAVSRFPTVLFQEQLFGVRLDSFVRGINREVS